MLAMVQTSEQNKCRTHLNSTNIGVLCGVLVLIETVLGLLSPALLNAQFDEEQHDRLQGRQGLVSGSFRGDMFVEKIESGGWLPDSNELISSLKIQNCQMDERIFQRKTQVMATDKSERADIP